MLAYALFRLRHWWVIAVSIVLYQFKIKFKNFI